MVGRFVYMIRNFTISIIIHFQLLLAQTGWSHIHKKGERIKILRDLLIVVFLVWIGGLAGCSDSTGSSKENTTTVVGFWFACEFGSSNDCMILDDDGYQFTTEGEIYDIEEATQGSEPECGQSPCFRADQKSLTVNRELIGTYTYDDMSVTIALDPNVRPACTENVIWNTSANFFESQSSCLPFESTHVKRYTGVVTIN